MNIFKWFQKREIDTIDLTFYRKIQEWKSWYNSNVRGFSFYRVYTGQGTYTKRRRKSLGMAKLMSEDIANLLINEKVAVCTEDQQTQDFVDKVLKNNRFQFMGNYYQEIKAAVGTVGYIPSLKDMEVSEDGEILSGKIGIDYVSAETSTLSAGRTDGSQSVSSDSRRYATVRSTFICSITTRTRKGCM